MSSNLSESIYCDKTYKILLLGDSSVGKTCFLLRYIEDTFTENHISTIGVDYKTKFVNIIDDDNLSKDQKEENGLEKQNGINTGAKEKMVKLQIWDTAGQDRFRCITKNYLRGSNGIMLIYDITNSSSFTNIKNWIAQIKESLGDTVAITLVGNKLDLEENLRKVTKEQGEALALEYNFKFLETSVKLNKNINKAFENLALDILKNKDKTNQNTNGLKMRNSNISNRNDENDSYNKSSSKCC